MLFRQSIFRISKMPFYDHAAPLPYDYERFTRGLAEKLQAYVDEASRYPAGSPQRQGILGTARNVYESWRHLARENESPMLEDDARFRAILAQKI